MGVKCDDRDIAMKSFFLGPQAENGPWLEQLMDEVLESWFGWRRGLFPEDGRAISDADIANPEFQGRRARFEGALRELMARFEGEVPKFSPRYVGHMFSEVSLPALMGHVVTLLHNPNNISGESSKVGTRLEDEAVGALLRAVGFGEGYGHFTSGGTIANIEALIRARARTALWLAAGAHARTQGEKLSLFEAAHLGWSRWGALHTDAEAVRPWSFVDSNPFQAGRALEQVFGEPFLGPVALVPEHKHYSWPKGISLLGLGDEALWSVALDRTGRLDAADLDRKLERAAHEGRPVMLAVSVVGSTELGVVDPVDEVQAVLERWRARGIHLWHHVDAAYGGFFAALDLDDPQLLSRSTARAIRAMGQADSVTLDPHKLGYVPYASGAILVRRAADYQGRTFGGPYVQFDRAHDKGPFTLEGSRSGAGAVATWLTSQAIGFDRQGYGRIIGRSIQIKRRLERALAELDGPIRIAPFADTNILGFCVAEPGASVSEANRATLKVVEALSPVAGGPFVVSHTRLSWKKCPAYLDELVQSWGGRRDADELVLVRACLMNPFFGSVEMATSFEQLFIDTVRELASPKPVRAAG